MDQFDKQFNVICLETEAFYALVEEVTDRIKKQHSLKEKKWINDNEAMDLLNIKSKSTLQKLRDEGSIRFSQPMKKVILYDRESIYEFLEQHSKDTF